MAQDLEYGIRLTGDASQLKQAFNEGGNAAADYAGKVEDASERVEQSAATSERLATAVRHSHTAWLQSVEGPRKWAETATETDAATRKLLDRYDPLSARLQRLRGDFDALSNAAKSGNVGAADDARVDATYARLNTEIKRTEEALKKFGPASAEGLASLRTHAEGGRGSIAGVRQELMTLGREAVTGDFGRMPTTFATLISRSGSLSGSILAIGAATATAAAGAYVFARAYNEGVAEVRQMNEALQVTSNYSGLTRGQMRQLADEVSQSGTVTIGTAKELVTQLAATGQIGAQAFSLVAKSAESFAAATSQDVSRIAPIMGRLFADPARGAEDLNRQMHFLSVAELERIRNLQQTGQLGEAQVLLAQRLNEHLPKQAEHLGTLERAWNAMGKAASSAWDRILGMGREESAEERVKRLTRQLEMDSRVLDQVSRGQAVGVGLDAATLKRQIERTRTELATATADAGKGQETASAAARAAEENRKNQEVAGFIRSYSKRAQVAELDARAKRIRDYQPTSDEESAQQQDALRQLAKQRRDLLNPKDERAEANKAAEQRYRTAIAEQEGLQRREQDSVRSHMADLDAQRRQGLISEEKLINERLAVQQSSIDQQIALAQKESQIAKRAGKTADVEKYDQEAARLAEQRNELEKAAARDLATLMAQRKSALADWIQTQQDALDQQEFERSLIGKTALEVERLTNARRIDLAVRNATKNADGTAKVDAGTAASYEKAGEDAKRQFDAAQSSDIRASDDWAVGARTAMSDYLKTAKSTAEQSRDTFATLFNGMGSALDQFVTTGKLNFRSFASSILADLARIAAQRAIVSMLSSFIGSAAGGASGSSAGASGTSMSMAGNGMTVAANGRVFGPSGLKAFASGGVLDRPTFFPFANGGQLARGLGGEAGDEALMPLGRMRNGKLGVSVDGGNGGNVFNVSISVEKAEGETSEETGAKIGRAFRAEVEAIADARIVNATRTGGALNRS